MFGTNIFLLFFFKKPCCWGAARHWLSVPLTLVVLVRSARWGCADPGDLSPDGCSASLCQCDPVRMGPLSWSPWPMGPLSWSPWPAFCAVRMCSSFRSTHNTGQLELDNDLENAEKMLFGRFWPRLKITDSPARDSFLLSSGPRALISRTRHCPIWGWVGCVPSANLPRKELHGLQSEFKSFWYKTGTNKSSFPIVRKRAYMYTSSGTWNLKTYLMGSRAERFKRSHHFPPHCQENSL